MQGTQPKGGARDGKEQPGLQEEESFRRGAGAPPGEFSEESEVEHSDLGRQFRLRDNLRSRASCR